MKRRGALALMALGIVLAGGASVLVWGIARQASEARLAAIPQVYVVMAAREIPAQEQVTPDALVLRPFPKDFVPADAIVAPDQAIGRFATSTIYKDQILLTGHVSVAKKSTSMSDRVPPGRVVVWLPMPDLIAGQVGFRPGDRLDILLSLPLNAPTGTSADGSPAPTANGGKLGTSTQTTLQNVEIFELSAPVEPGVSANANGATAHTGGNQALALLVDHQDAVIIKYIKDSGGTIDLALRSSDEDRIVRTDAVTVDSVAERFRFRVPQEVQR
jgi:pilus assembly protein CpaB